MLSELAFWHSSLQTLVHADSMQGTLPLFIEKTYASARLSRESPVMFVPFSYFGFTRLKILPRKVFI
jgi:hypothetical protein